MLRSPEYNVFLDYMCPEARGLGMSPPPGTDTALCPRTILGTWDDHDYGWNDGDGRLENKWVGIFFVCVCVENTFLYTAILACLLLIFFYALQ